MTEERPVRILPWPYRKRDVEDAARRILESIRQHNEGRLPPNFYAARKLIIGCGLSCEGVRQPPNVKRRQTLTGRLDEDPRGEWTVYYNADHSEDKRLRYLIHELAEWFAIGDYPTLFDGLPGTSVYRYDGGDDPTDVRHRIAYRVEVLYLEAMRFQGQ